MVGAQLTASIPTPSSAPRSSSGRVLWVDAAKGIAILMVALAHSVQWTTQTDLAPDVWNRINLLFIVFRMPLFFLASGLFAASILRRSWPELWRTRLSLLVWALLIWSLIRFVYFRLVPDPSGIDPARVEDLLLAAVRPSNGLWFLYALAVFFVVMKLLRDRVNWRIQLAGAAVLSIAFFARADTGNIAWNGIGRYFVFFMVGCFFRDRIVAFVERSGVWLGLGLGAAFVVLAGGVLLLDSRVPFITGMLIVASLLAIGSGLVLARSLSTWRPTAWLAYIGRHTLPVYVIHVLIVSALTIAVLPAAGTGALRLAAPVLPLLVAGTAVATSLGIWRLTRSLPVLRFGFEVPTWFSGQPRVGERVDRVPAGEVR